MIKYFTFKNASILVFSLFGALFFILFSRQNKPLAFVNKEKVFSEFKMTQEIQRQYSRDLQLFSQKSDSLRALIGLASTNQERQGLIFQISGIDSTAIAYQNDFQNNAALKVWERINSYAKDYSKINNYDAILGQSSTGDVLYAAPMFDVTSDFLKFINKKYEGL